MTAEPNVHQDSRAVEVTFTPRREDYAAALKAWSRTRKTALPLRPWFVAVFEAVVVALLALRIVDDGLADGLLPAYWVLPLLPVFPASAQYFAARAAAKANAHHGEITSAIDDGGVRYSSAHAEFRGAWSNFGRYLETPSAFVLFSPDKGGNMIHVFAKRGLATDADAERLRALLAAHLEPVSRS